MNCPTCGTDDWDFINNNDAQCVNGHRFTVGADSIEDNRDPYCAMCRVPEHDQCGADLECPCCQDTAISISEGR